MGDNNMAYFHQVASVRSRINLISQTEVDGELISDLWVIETKIREFYTSLFDESQVVPFSLGGLDFQMVDNTTNTRLIAPFGE